MLFPSAILAFCLLWTVTSARKPPTVYLIRHAEKPADKADHRLTHKGKERAQCLRTVFGAESEYNIGYIIAPTVKKHGKHSRPFETVRPLAKDLGLRVDTHCSRKSGACVADAIRDYDGPGNILISWRHGTISDIQWFLGSEYPLEYPYDRYDLIWTFPYPYDVITEVRAEHCPGIDIPSPGLVVQD
ncbi:hypothetical protein N7481_010998 [Penicillium waksmanii]|uniref:uncharacterized protein n=1 Tax=Penicillium waksmanii TaxID=69791 RepID=UPI002548E922|nr:uncharacterized protein N7481_010998 [Penicillium waksmanii]KAJ5973788.1 hypothetical protein N7481_010998 [Penicillium waksmanii]